MRDEGVKQPSMQQVHAAEDENESSPEPSSSYQTLSSGKRLQRRRWVERRGAKEAEVLLHGVESRGSSDDRAVVPEPLR